MKLNHCLAPMPFLFLIGNSPAAVIAADCLSLQRAVNQETYGQSLNIKLKEFSVCRIAPLEILHKKNINLDGGNSTLIFSGNHTGIHIGDESENISISNVNIDYNPLPFTQGIISQIRDGYISFTIMEFYPPVELNNNRVLIFDASTRKLKIDGSTLYFKKFEIDEGGRSGRIPISANYQAPLHVGDLIAFRPRGNPAIRLDGLSSNIRLNNISIFSSPGMGVMGRYLDGDNYVNVRIIPGKPPSGSIHDRLLSTNADGVNVAYARKGPTIENSTISRQGDDGINLHGLILGIHSISGAKDALAFRPFGNDNSIGRILRPGDNVRFLAKDDFHILGRARIRKIETIGNFRLAPTNGNLFPRASAEGAKTGTFYILSFYEGIPPETVYIDAVSAASQGFLIKNNMISLNRGHGIVVGASNGEITGNVIASTTHNSIIVGPNFIPWREGSWPNHVSIVGNTISNPCTDGMKDRKINERSSIFIGGDGKTQSAGISDISIRDNRIESCQGQWIKANNVTGISLSNNNIVKERNLLSSPSCETIIAEAVGHSKNAILRGNQCGGAHLHPRN